MKSISVIIPTYNNAIYIERCLRSLEDQSIDANFFDIIVIDDGSMDNTSEIVKKKFPNVKLISRTENKGLPFSVNEGLRSSKSTTIVRVDSDDYVHRNFLEYLLFFYDNNKTFQACACDYYITNKDGNSLKQVNCEEEPIACGILFDYQVLVSLGLYDEAMLYNEDKDLMHRFIKANYKILRVPAPLYRYRMHESNISNNKNLVDKFNLKLKEKIK